MNVDKIKLAELPEPDFGSDDFDVAYSYAQKVLEAAITMFGAAGVADVTVLQAFLCALADGFVQNDSTGWDFLEFARRAVVHAMPTEGL
jgi:hypothetical protein